jgi:hypothetical protein
LINKIRTMAIAALIAITSLGLAASPVAASVEALCALDQWNPGLTGQYYFDYNAAASLDDVYGYVTDRPIYPCIGTSSQGFVFSAAVSIQSPTGSIWQLGILQEAGSSQHYFVYTAFRRSGAYTKITSVYPTAGTRYQFRIWWDKTINQMRFRVASASGGTTYWSALGYSWDASIVYAWWGWESGNSKSQGGLTTGSSAADQTGSISTTSLANVYPVTQIVTHCTVPPGC